MLRRMGRVAGVLLIAVASAPAAHAAEFYAAATFMQSLGRDNSSGAIEVLPITVLGSDGDSSLGYGLAAGFGFDFDEVLPKKWNSWGTAFRVESEFVYGREWEFVSHTEDPAGNTLAHKFFDEVKAWTFMPVNLYIDVPLRRPMSKIFGRVPMLEPVDLSFGFGAGVSHVHINAFDNIAEATNGVYKSAFQANVALSYEFSERTKVQFGYRYLDLGATKADLEYIGIPGADPGIVDLDLKAHEFVLAMRYGFDQKPLADMHFPLPRWLTGDKNRPPPKPKKPGKKHDWFKRPRWLGGKSGP